MRENFAHGARQPLGPPVAECDADCGYWKLRPVRTLAEESHGHIVKSQQVGRKRVPKRDPNSARLRVQPDCERHGRITVAGADVLEVEGEPPSSRVHLVRITGYKT